MLNPIQYLIYFLIFTIMCQSCRLGPKYAPPVVEVPENWKSQPNDEETKDFTGLWWEVFEDDTLDYLEKVAITNSPNLFAALDRVAQARAIAGIDKAALYPHINLNPSYSNIGTLFKLYLPPGIPKNLFGTVPNPYRIHELQYNLPFNMSYELDLWGKYRGQYESAIFDSESQWKNFQASLITLTADVAISYFQIRSYNTQILIFEKNITLLNESLRLTQARFQKGLVNYEDVVSAEQILNDTEASYQDIIRQKIIQENILATLIGTLPSNLELFAYPLVVAPPKIPAGIPSAILVQRPDISAAERNMASQHALIGVAYASFLPSIELTGTLGYSSPTLKDFLTWKSRLWGVGVNAAQSIFDAGRNQSNLDLTFARFQESLHQYQQQVLTAFQEVENALANLEWQSKQYISYSKSAEAAKTRLQLSKRRYLGGLVSYLNVIDSERVALQAELSQVNVLGSRYISTIQLIKAFGGSWMSFQTVAEQPASCCQCEEGNNCHRPDICEDNI